LRRLRQYGQSDRYHHIEPGVNSRLDELQAAILRSRLPRLERWNTRRAEIAASYAEALAESPVGPLALLPNRRHVFHLYVVQAPERGTLQRHLEAADIQTLIHYPKPVHLHPPYRRLAGGPVSLSASERFCARILSLPLYPELSDAEVERVTEALRAFA
jgi:dTDP-4-amino-4,6-dideoxygalactose transaminase